MRQHHSIRTVQPEWRDASDPQNAPPSTPTNISPTDATTDASLTPTLTAPVFSDPDTGDTHAATQWQVRTSASAGDWSATVYDQTTIVILHSAGYDLRSGCRALVDEHDKRAVELRGSSGRVETGYAVSRSPTR